MPELYSFARDVDISIFFRLFDIFGLFATELFSTPYLTFVWRRGPTFDFSPHDLQRKRRLGLYEPEKKLKTRKSKNAN